MKIILSIISILICSIIATFFITIFNPEGVLGAIEIFKNLIGGLF